MPQYFLRPEEEQSVKLLDAQINNKQQELEYAIADVPTYALPDMYRTAEQRSMSDEEYLQYLREADAQRMAQIQTAKNQPAVSTPGTAVQTTYTPSVSPAEPSTARKVGKIIFNVCSWIVSVILTLLAIIMFSSEGGIISGIIWFLTALLVNPSIGDLIYYKVVKFPRWIVAIILVVNFFVGVFAFSPPQSTIDAISSETTITETT